MNMYYHFWLECKQATAYNILYNDNDDDDEYQSVIGNLYYEVYDDYLY